MKRNQTKILSIMLVSIMAILMVLSQALASSVGEPIGIEITKVMVNGAEVSGEEDLRTQFLRNDELDIIVVLKSEKDQNNVEVKAFISGYEHKDISSNSETFDIEAGVMYQKKFNLVIPSEIEKDDYKLRILVTDRYGAVYYANYNLKISTQRHDIMIKDIDFSPNNEVKAGRSFTAVVNMKNVGDKDQNNIKITMEIPEMGLVTTGYVNKLYADDIKQSEELYVRIPECQEAGEYTVKFTVRYDNGNKEETAERTIKVAEGDLCIPATPVKKATIIMDSNLKSVVKGATTVYDLTIINEDQVKNTYVLEISGTEKWATTTMTPSNVLVVEAGESKTVALSVTPSKDAETEQKAFLLKVKSGDSTLKEIALTADVTQGKASGWEAVKKGLQAGLIVLVVILIVLGVILLINRMKEPKTEEEVSEDELGSDFNANNSESMGSESETYY